LRPAPRAQLGCTPAQGNFFNVSFDSLSPTTDVLADLGVDAIVSVRLIGIDPSVEKGYLKYTRANGQAQDRPINVGSSITVSGAQIALEANISAALPKPGAVTGCIKIN